jgi:hypothetical protein
LDQKPNLIQDDARLMPRFRAGGELLERHRMSRAQAAALADGIADRGASDSGREQRSAKAEPGDLRGIPVIGRGVGGASPGSSPESAISRVDRDRAARRRVVIAESGPREPMVAYG